MCISVYNLKYGGKHDIGTSWNNIIYHDRDRILIADKL